MKTFRNMVLASLYLFIATSVSCNEQEKTTSKRNYKVQIAFEPDFYNESRIDTVILSKSILADTSKNTKHFENYVGQENYIVEPGEITISAVSIFERKYSKTLNISSDTSIIFHKSDFPMVFEETDIWDNDLYLKNNDTLVVYYFNGNCFTSDEFASVRKISIFKNGSTYLVKYSDLPRGTAEIKSSYKTKQLGSQFSDKIKHFYSKVKAEKERKQDIVSTSNSYMFIRIDNKIYQITDPHFLIGNLYDNLIKDINGT